MFSFFKKYFYKSNIDVLYCGNCDKDTNQKINESGHERDSSHDRFECLECGFIKYGLTGEWENYN
jgi:transcription elongation factor Elf1